MAEQAQSKRERNKPSAKFVQPPPEIEVSIGYTIMPVRLSIPEAKSLLAQLTEALKDQ